MHYCDLYKNWVREMLSLLYRENQGWEKLICPRLNSSWYCWASHGCVVSNLWSSQLAAFNCGSQENSDTMNRNGKMHTYGAWGGREDEERQRLTVLLLWWCMRFVQIVTAFILWVRGLGLWICKFSLFLQPSQWSFQDGLDIKLTTSPTRTILSFLFLWT